MSNDEKKPPTKDVSHEAVERQIANIHQKSGGRISSDQARKIVVDAIAPVNRERRERRGDK